LRTTLKHLSATYKCFCAPQSALTVGWLARVLQLISTSARSHDNAVVEKVKGIINIRILTNIPTGKYGNEIEFGHD